MALPIVFLFNMQSTNKVIMYNKCRGIKTFALKLSCKLQVYVSTNRNHSDYFRQRMEDGRWGGDEVVMGEVEKSVWLTSQILDEVLQLHLPLRFDVWAVHICVEEDDGKRQDEDGVWVLELPDQNRVANTIPLAEEKVRRCKVCGFLFLSKILVNQIMDCQNLVSWKKEGPNVNGSKLKLSCPVLSI